ncbi:SNF2 domain-containing protein / helicase domain-containing protein / zinc finger protein-related [Raphanus sativus]|nr:SNF2 domain-containing protein / helicase domain-containing protein / zinc finger protein-related [Raphanus sativus]
MDSAIEISSDSDVEIQETRTTLPPPHPLLPQGSTLRPHLSIGSSSNANGLTRVGLLPLPSSSRNAFEAKPVLSSRNAFEAKPLTNGHHIGSQQALTRVLPPSLTRPPMPLRPGIRPPIPFLTSNANGSHFRGVYPPAGTPAASGSGINGNFGGGYGGFHDGIGTGRVVNGDRLFPQSSGPPHATAASTSHFNGGGGDPLHRNGMGEDRSSETDETLVYQAVLQNLNQPKSEVDLPDGLLAVPLMKHQKIALAWMFQKETRSAPCLGGILADDQGLGKTISTIALILKQMHEAKPKSENSSNQVAEALDLDADDESENAFVKQESKAIRVNGMSSNQVAEALDLDADDESENAFVKQESKAISVNGSYGMKKGKNKEEASTSTRKFKGKRPAAGTLIVCPASVVRQWARELDEKVTEEAKLSVLIYHGGNRTKDPTELAKYDVVMTTYAIVSNEVPKVTLEDDDENDKKTLEDGDENDEKYAERNGLASGFVLSKKRKSMLGGKSMLGAPKKSKKRGKKNADDSDPNCGTLAKVGWFRVVLDEAQTIKNHKTQVARACCGLRAKRRWCLSGTPIQNTIDDLFSYFRFLRYDPYAVYKSFYNTIKLPISRNSPNGYKKLQAILKAIMLRRTKGTLLDGKPIINLPPKTINLSKVDFSVEERSFYTKLEADSRSQFKAYYDAGTLNQNYASILLMLLRLRQACDHPQLTKGFKSNSVGKESEGAAKRLSREVRVSLLNRLESSPICRACNDPPEVPVITLCGHIFCYQCVSEYITGDENSCPVCREQLAHDAVFSQSTLRSCMAAETGCSSSSLAKDILQSLSNQGSQNSTQNGGMPSSSQPYDVDDDDDVTIIEEQTSVPSNPHNQEPVKTIIFSQWTSMLDVLELSLNERTIEFRRLDGTMSLAARDRAIKEFSNDPDVKVMIMSLKAGNLGLNMVAASHVILLDLWWNPTTEDQAIDRAHRIGQTRPVTVTRITITNTVEDRILALQEEKRAMVASAFGEEYGGSSATRLTVDDLKYLFMA